jgi:hypothetical protein
MRYPVDGVMDETRLFVRMARELPIRTVIFSFGLPLFAMLQLVNGYLNDGAVEFIAVFALATVAFSVTLTRYQVAVYRRRLITDNRSRERNG